MKLKPVTQMISLAVVGSSLTISPFVSAQSMVIEEVTVTARRTEESIQSVPVSVTALDANTLRESSITSTEDLQMGTPGVYLAGSGGRQNVIYQIRGQAKALSGSTQPAVVSYFAEVPEPVWGSSVPQFDMANIQVLKGPQGTLFGRNTTGGAILYTPQAPEHELSGYVGGTLGDYNHRRAQGAINLPLIEDRVALRIAGDVNKRDGYTKNIGVGGDLDDIDTKALRLSLLVEPNDYISNTTIFDHFKSQNNGTGIVLETIYEGQNALTGYGLIDGVRAQLAQQKARGPLVTESPDKQFENSERNSLINRTEIDFGDLQLVNIFGYRNTALGYVVNVDGMPLIPSAAYGGLPMDIILADKYDQSEQYSNELQLRGTSLEDKLEWLIGAFWLQNEPKGYQANGVSLFKVEGITPITGAAYNFQTEESRAVFTNLRYSLDDFVSGLQFEVGVRYTEDELEACVGYGVKAQGNDATLADCESRNATKIVGVSELETSSEEITWQVGLNWQIDDDLFAYMVHRRGYRAGGVNSPVLVGRLAKYQGFDPEIVTDYEIGIRADWSLGDMFLRTNVSTYLSEVENTQSALSGVNTQLPSCDPSSSSNPAPVSPDGDCDASNDPNGGTLLANMGEREISGVDLEVVLMPTENLTLNIGASYLNNETTEYNVPSELSAYAGNSKEIPLVYTADQTVVAGIRYELPLAEMAESLVFNLDYYWSDKLVKADLFLPSYDITNFRVDLYGVGGKQGLDLGFYVRNLFDDEIQLISGASSVALGFASVTYAAPRIWGAELRYSF
ncbi:MAG: TonB-dependent receptor [Spongiibacteraceae bacterium]